MDFPITVKNLKP